MRAAGGGACVGMVAARARSHTTLAVVPRRWITYRKDARPIENLVRLSREQLQWKSITDLGELEENQAQSVGEKQSLVEGIAYDNMGDGATRHFEKRKVR